MNLNALMHGIIYIQSINFKSFMHILTITLVQFIFVIFLKDLLLLFFLTLQKWACCHTWIAPKLQNSLNIRQLLNFNQIHYLSLDHTFLTVFLLGKMKKNELHFHLTLHKSWKQITNLFKLNLNLVCTMLQQFVMFYSKNKKDILMIPKASLHGSLLSVK